MKKLRKLLMKYLWIYERCDGDRGIVIAKNYEKAIEKLSKIYPDTRERINKDTDDNKWMSIFDAYCIDVKGDVFITEPY